MATKKELDDWLKKNKDNINYDDEIDYLIIKKNNPNNLNNPNNIYSNFNKHRIRQSCVSLVLEYDYLRASDRRAWQYQIEDYDRLLNGDGGVGNCRSATF